MRIRRGLSEVALRDSAQLVQDFLADNGYRVRVRELPSSARTSAEAAAAVGCNVAQIAKSLVFRAQESDRAVLAIASGANRARRMQATFARERDSSSGVYRR
jgi:prolyl-tRNA editing enzyme YbaK/EbsC (Cys-tRNA(Pro) deacylase)